MDFRKILIRIRKEFNENKKRLLIYSISGSLISIILGVIADALLPFAGLSNILRTIILIPTSACLFIVFYTIGLFGHYKKLREDPEWKPYRTRLSPAWRRRVSAIAAAVGFIAVYANGFRIGYTLVSSLFVVLIIALFAFMRTTRDEERREMFSIPDPRDTQYASYRKKLESDRAFKARQKKEIRSERWKPQGKKD